MMDEVSYKNIETYVEELKYSYKKLTDFEALSIAVRMQRNDILASAFVVSQADRHPTALEKIAMQLGATPNI